MTLKGICGVRPYNRKVFSSQGFRTKNFDRFLSYNKQQYLNLF